MISFFLVSRVGMSSVLTDTKSILVPKIPVTVPVYEGKNRYQERQKSVPNWYLTSFGSENLVPVGTQYRLLIFDHGFHTNKIVTIQFIY
ncbi:hypothetical protein Hanom_Chr12g01111281 [Helianthus anomalus]